MQGNYLCLALWKPAMSTLGAGANVLQKRVEYSPVVNKSTCIYVLCVEKMFSVQMN